MWGSEFWIRVWGAEFGCRIRCVGFGVWLGLRLPGAKFRAFQGSGVRLQLFCSVFRYGVSLAFGFSVGS